MTDSKYLQEALEESAEVQQDPDAWDQRILQTGCYAENMALQLCHADTGDWKQCLQEMAMFRKCWELHENAGSIFAEDPHHTSAEKLTMRVVKKPSKKAVKKLHGALKNMLKRESLDSRPECTERATLPDITEAVKNELVVTSRSYGNGGKEPQNHPSRERDGILYIMSKENQLIPKLTDDQVMKLHKKADENMKQVWSDIIAKYEAVEDQGDVIDMRTGELVEDNGHIRGISHGNSETRYKSTLKGLIDVEESVNECEIWQDEGEEEDDDYEVEEEFYSSDEGSEGSEGSEGVQQSDADQ